MPIQSGNLGVAFALTCGAGLATGLGASVVFFPKLVKLASRRVLASGLGLSAGVMTYVSFVEIFPAGVEGFVEALGHDRASDAYSYATLCFFAGVVILYIIDLFIHKVLGVNHHHDNGVECVSFNDDEVKVDKQTDVIQQIQKCTQCGFILTDTSGSTIENWQRKAEEEIEHEIDADGGVELQRQDSATKSDEESFEGGITDHHEKNNLNRMGMTSAIAIAVHNFPEGIATFVAALHNPRVGFILAIAIGLHNIPEGLCVALPIYYSTGSRWKGFLWGFCSGLAEPFAALLGWLILASVMTPATYGVLDALIAGMMIAISSKELLPTAHRYDEKDTVVSFSYFAGMAIMALSLIAFGYVQ